MAFITLAQGLTIVVPTNGTRSWGATLLTNTWSKISSHDHSGGGKGALISSSGLAKNVAFGSGSTLTPAGTTQTVDLNTGNNQYLDLSSATGDVTLTISNPVAGAWYTIWVTQGGTPRNLIYPGTVKWPQAQPPILSGAGKTDLIQLFYTGAVFRGLWELDFS